MTRNVAFLFPGQGGLPDTLAPLTTEIEALFEIAVSRGLPIRSWIEDGEAERLFPTDVAQPAILIDSLAHDGALRRAGFTPALVAGHSLGEFAALVSAGVLDAEDALALVIERGALMAQATGGAMAAIVKLDLETVERLCRNAGPEVVVANHNGTHQVVVSGTEEAVAAVSEAAGAGGGRGIRLKVSGAFHSPFMADARDALAERIDRTTFREPAVPIVSSVSGQVERDPERIRSLVRDQMTACVRWADVMERLVEHGVSQAIEAGSGNVLTGLGRRFTEAVRFLTYEEAIDEDL